MVEETEFRNEPISQGVTKMASEFKPQIEERLGREFNTYKIIQYQSQFMGGTYHRLRIEVDGGKVLVANIYEDQPISGGVKTLQEVSYEF